MKLEYLDDISDAGKYKDVVSENLVRLYDFGQKETTQLVNLIYQRLILDKQSLDLTTAGFIQPSLAQVCDLLPFVTKLITANCCKTNNGNAQVTDLRKQRAVLF